MQVATAGNPVPVLVEPDLTAARTAVRELANFASYADQFNLPPPDSAEASVVVQRAASTVDFHICAVHSATNELENATKR